MRAIGRQHAKWKASASSSSPCMGKWITPPTSICQMAMLARGHLRLATDYTNAHILTMIAGGSKVFIDPSKITHESPWNIFASSGPSDFPLRPPSSCCLLHPNSTWRIEHTRFCRVTRTHSSACGQGNLNAIDCLPNTILQYTNASNLQSNLVSSKLIRHPHLYVKGFENRDCTPGNYSMRWWISHSHAVCFEKSTGRFLTVGFNTRLNKSFIWYAHQQVKPQDGIPNWTSPRQGWPGI